MGGNIKKLSKQDRARVRQATDVERRYRLQEIEPLREDVDDIRNDFLIDLVLSASSVNAIANKTVTNELAKKVTKVKGKDLSTNDFTNEYKEKIDNIDEDKKYSLSSYKTAGVTIERSSCVKKHNRVCLSFAGAMTISANKVTSLFTFPEDIRPKVIKDFIVYGENTSGTVYIGYGEITTEGILQLTFKNDISTKIRFSTVYDLD